MSCQDVPSDPHNTNIISLQSPLILLALSGDFSCSATIYSGEQWLVIVGSSDTGANLYHNISISSGYIQIISSSLLTITIEISSYLRDPSFIYVFWTKKRSSPIFSLLSSHICQTPSLVSLAQTIPASTAWLHAWCCTCLTADITRATVYQHQASHEGPGRAQAHRL